MTFGIKTVRAALLGAAILSSAIGLPPLIGQVAHAGTDVVAVVNRVPITSTDLAHRIAFLKLRHEKGDLAKMAKEELVDQQLKRQEIARVGLSVSTDDVDRAFARFAQSNKLTVKQMSEILDKSGVGVDHFKAYIAVQMSWPRVVNARYHSSGQMSNQQMVTRLLETKERPVTTDYFLKQVVFVVPADKRNAILARRKAEADASRAKFPGCDQAMQFAAGYKDVSILTLGHVLLPEIPPDWKDLIIKAKGNTTETRVTPRGVEYLAICSQKQVSDDMAAKAVFEEQELNKAEKENQNPDSVKFLNELKKQAVIIYP
ncbi:SurA N-terminal domain-containing protein [Allorhizobium sp. BGMRC 0089]|uniref:SurA N-terminal domain-containing protein n=1 Tax=Allorhizobium sonneratiae TaxID=2934936 RepID=UPI0020345163|nr:SurA N-terminal domain-containing protein [Allorhizobium sonneratiae]MCM2292060.1 SurA N-terminal domain-containing protein [Allorhizobium sonneratiae]